MESSTYSVATSDSEESRYQKIDFSWTTYDQKKNARIYRNKRLNGYSIVNNMTVHYKSGAIIKIESEQPLVYDIRDQAFHVNNIKLTKSEFEHNFPQMALMHCLAASELYDYYEKPEDELNFVVWVSQFDYATTSGQLKIHNSSLKPERFTKIKPILELDILSDRVVLGGGSCMTIIDQNHNISDYDIYVLASTDEDGRYYYSKFDDSSILGECEDSYLMCGGLDWAYPLHFVPTLTKLVKEHGFKCVRVREDNQIFCLEKGDITIQLITSPHNNPHNFLGGYDLRACMIGYDGEYVYTYRTTVRDIHKKSLMVSSLHNPASTLNRAIKYSRKNGYDLPASELRLILSALSRRPDHNYEINDY